MAGATLPDISRFKGDTIPFVFNVSSGGAVVNVTGWTFTMSVDSRRNPSDTSTQLFQLSGVITDGPNGQVTFTPSAPNMTLPSDVYYYDVKSDDGSVVRTYGVGLFVVTNNLSQ